MEEIENIWDAVTTDEMPIGFKIYDGEANPHYHSFTEIFYIISGKSTHFYNKKTPEQLTTGDMYLILPNNYHFFKQNGPCPHRDIIIRTKYFKEICDIIDCNLYNGFINSKIPIHIKISPATIEYFEEQINLINHNLLPTKEKLAIIKALTISILEPFLAFNVKSTDKEFPSWFKRLLDNFTITDYIKEGLPRILKGFNYSSKYLCKVFKKYMNMTMTEYLNIKRLELSIRLLKYSDKTVTEIVGEIGYSSTAYFNTIFKKHYGVTPKEVRHGKNEK